MTVLPFLTLAPAPGLCERTIPSFLAFVTVFVCLTTLNPAAGQCAASAGEAVSPLTSGTFAVVGALAITSDTFEPTTATVFPPGDWLMTSPAVAVLDVCVLV